MLTEKPTPVICTDKWNLNPTARQRVLLSQTVKVYRRVCRHLMGILLTHWPSLGGLSGQKRVLAVEKLIHQTAKNPNPKYRPFDPTFYKFPSYYRRAAIVFAAGQVSSYMTRYREWQSGTRQRRDAKPPGLNPNSGCYPTLYKGQCHKLHGYNRIEIKVFNGTDWVWTTVGITGLRERHTVASNKLLSPSLIFNEEKRACHLSVPFECHPPQWEGDGNVVSVDLGINITATVAVVNFDGTVIHREFIHPGRDIDEVAAAAGTCVQRNGDRRDKRLKSVSKRASQTMGNGGSLQKGFCSHTYRKCRNINRQIGQIVSKRIVQIAQQFNADAIVFENLKGWKARGGRKRSNLRQRFHGWLKGMIRELTEMKWQEMGGKVIDVVAAYTSKLAYDGSGVVRRDSKNYARAKFSSGKRYNADLNGALNIAARGIRRGERFFAPTRRKDSEERSSQRSRRSPRSWACLCDLWTHTVSG